eukprot:10640162-Heterocapsa_arctica.AAC.1
MPYLVPKAPQDLNAKVRGVYGSSRRTATYEMDVVVLSPRAPTRGTGQNGRTVAHPPSHLETGP